MTLEKRKITAKKVRNLYLYPYRSKEENLARGAVWMVSWLTGIIAQQNANQQATGGAYLIFALSLLLEFLPESKEYLLAKIVHGVFYILLLIMLLGSALLSFWKITDAQAKISLTYKLLLAPLPYIGWTVFAMIAIGTILALAEVHKCFYDDEIEGQRRIKAEHDAILEQFQKNLEGSPKGGNA